MIARGLSARYVLYEMEPWEAAALLRRIDPRERSDWERTRVLAYIMAQTHSSTSLTPSEVLPLPWDDDLGGFSDKTPEQERAEFEAVRAKAKVLEKIL